MIKKLLLTAVVLITAVAVAPAQDRLKNYVKEKYGNKTKKVENTDMAPNFTLKNQYGQSVSLSDYRGSWVVLDFWGTWCPWCIKGIPEMKEAYERYHHRGLEIIGIDCGDSMDEWKAGIKKYELPWVNVYNPEGGNVTSKYDVSGYPTKVIINPQGEIAKVIVGEDPEFYEILDMIFDPVEPYDPYDPYGTLLLD